MPLAPADAAAAWLSVRGDVSPSFLIRRGRALAGLGCLAVAVIVLVGFFVHLGTLTNDRGLTQAGVALLMLIAVLLAGGAAGTRAAARSLGIPS